MTYYLEIENGILVAVHSLKPDYVETIEYTGDIDIIMKYANKQIPDEVFNNANID